MGNSENGFWQGVEYEFLPDYCKKCRKIGHPEEKCRPGEVNQRRNARWERKKAPNNNSGLTGEVKDAEAFKQREEKSKEQEVKEVSQQSTESHGSLDKEPDHHKTPEPNSESKDNEKTEKAGEKGRQEEEDTQDNQDTIEHPLAMVVFDPFQFKSADGELRDQKFLAGKAFEKEFHGKNQEKEECSKDKQASPPYQQNITDEDGFIEVKKKGKNKEKQKVSKSSRVTRSLALSIKSD